MAWLAWSLTHAAGAVTVVTIAANAPAFVMTLIGACTRIGAPFAPAPDALVAPADSLVKASGLLQVSFRAAPFRVEWGFRIFTGPFPGARLIRARASILPP